LPLARLFASATELRVVLVLAVLVLTEENSACCINALQANDVHTIARILCAIIEGLKNAFSLSIPVCELILQTMRPEMFDAQSNQQHVPNLPNLIGTVSDVQCDSGSAPALSCVNPVTEQPTLPPVSYHPPAYYVTTMGMGVSAPGEVTTSATHWQPTQYMPPQPVSRPMPGTYGTPPKPEMAFLFPVCMPSSETGHVMSLTGVLETSPTSVSPSSPATTALNPLMNSTKYVAFLLS